MNYIFVIIFIIIIILVVFLKYKTKKSKKEPFDNSCEPKPKKNKIPVKIQENNLNPNFQEAQFHTDYRDIITVLNNLIPNTKYNFNSDNLAVDFSENNPEINFTAYKIISDFISNINYNIINTITEFRNKNSGWDELLPEQKQESGFEKQQKKLGLPETLYENPAKKSTIKLIQINSTQKYQTSQETKYNLELVIQKLNTPDQLVLQISFISKKNNPLKIILENHYILGYLTKLSDNLNLEPDLDNKYNFDQLNQNQITPEKIIQAGLAARYEKIKSDQKIFYNMLDQEQQKFQQEIGNL